MKKVKVLKPLLVVATVLGLSSCGLSSVEKDAKKYMKANPTGFESFNYGGSGLKYSADLNVDVVLVKVKYTVNFDFSTNKGSCKSSISGTDVSFNFTASYDYKAGEKEASESAYKYTLKNSKGDEKYVSVISAAVSTNILAAYTTVIGAAYAQNNAQ